jgi:hypothetical protein
MDSSPFRRQLMILKMRRERERVTVNLAVPKAPNQRTEETTSDYIRLHQTIAMGNCHESELFRFPPYLISRSPFLRP